MAEIRHEGAAFQDVCDPLKIYQLAQISRPVEQASFEQLKAAEDKEKAERIASQVAERRKKNPNPVTVLGITIGDPLSLPACKDDKAGSSPFDTCSFHGVYSSKDFALIALNDEESKNYPWLGGYGCGLVAPISVGLSESGVVSFCINTRGLSYHDAALDALVQKFGKPELQTTITWQDARARQYSLPYVRWRGNGVTVVLDYRPGGAVFGTITVTDDHWAQEVEKKKRSAKPI